MWDLGTLGRMNMSSSERIENLLLKALIAERQYDFQESERLIKEALSLVQKRKIG